MLVSSWNVIPSIWIGPASAPRNRDRHLAGRAAGPGGGQQHRELVAAQPRHQVAGTHAVREAVRDDLEDPVPDRMPECVVDHLEAVQVEQQESDPATAARRVGQRVAGVLDADRRRLGRPVSSSCSAWCSRLSDIAVLA